MSVLIKGMEMPMVCRTCQFLLRINHYDELGVCGRTRKDVTQIRDKRDKDCPAVLDYVLKDNYCNGGWFEIEEDKYVEWLKALPSVTPKPKTGHWTKEETIDGWDRKSYQCSCCGRSIHLDTVMEDLDDYPYCHCGAKMEEGEDKE